MKVGIFAESFPPTIDGVANAAYNYARVLTSMQDDVVVATPKYPNITDEYEFPVYRYPSVKFMKTLEYRAGYPFLPQNISDLRGMNFDIIHSHCPFVSSMLAREVTAARSARVPVVFTYHTKYSIDLDRWVRIENIKTLAKKLIISNVNSADEVWVVSKGAGEDLVENGYRGEYRVMPNGVDYELGITDPDARRRVRAKLEIPDGVPILLFTGRMMWYKNLKLIIDALKLVKAEGLVFRMVFVGDGADRPAVEQYAAHEGLKDYTTFTGAIYDRDKLRRMYEAADMFIFPSTFDTSGLAPKEAAACFCPSLLIKGSCAAEDTEDGVSAFLAEENAESCAEQIAAALKNPEYRKQIGIGASQKLYCSWEQSVGAARERYGEIIEEFAGRKKHRFFSR